MGHEGDGSILSYLKKLGLATELAAGEKNSSPGFNFFTVDIELTIEGLSKKILIQIIIFINILFFIKNNGNE